MNIHHTTGVLLAVATLPAAAVLSPTINPLGRTINVETTTGGGFISLADLQTLVTTRNDLTSAAVLTGDGLTFISTTPAADRIVQELANNGAPALFTFTGPQRYARNDSTAGASATSGSYFGFVATSETWNIGSTFSGGGVTHFGSTFYNHHTTGGANLVSVIATLDDASTITYTATATTQQRSFVGFAAPEGRFITSVQVNESSAGQWVSFDDVTIVLSDPAGAVSTWDGGGADDLWSSAANWSGDTTPIPGSQLNFGPGEKTSPQNNLTAGIGYASIQFTSTAPSYQISGNAISPGPTITNGSAQPQTFDLPLVLQEDLTVATTGTLLFNGVVSGPAHITKTGADAAWFNAANSFTGGLTIQQGTVNFDGDQSAANGNIDIAIANQSAATLAIGGTAAVASGNLIRLGAQGQPAGSAAATLDVLDGGVLNNSGELQIRRHSTLHAFGTVNQSGPTILEGVGGFGATLQVPTGGTFNYLHDQTLLLRSGSNNNARARVDVNGGTLVTGQGFEQILSAFHGAYTTPMPITSGVILSGGGTLKLSADVDALFTPLSPPVAAETPIFQIDAGGGIIDTNGHATTLAIPLSGAGLLTKKGTGTLTLGGVNTHTGGTVIEAGTLASTHPAGFADASSITVTSGATLHLGFTGEDTITGLTLGETTLGPGTYSNATHGSFITGTGSLVIPISDPYLAWLASFPSITAPADKEKTADPDHDGLPNFVEFALDGNPASGTASGKIVTTLHEDHLTLTLPVRTDVAFSPTGTGPLSGSANGIIYRIEGTGDLSSFTATIETITPALTADLPTVTTPGWSYRTFRISTPVSGASKGFIRAVIDQVLAQ